MARSGGHIKTESQKKDADLSSPDNKRNEAASSSETVDDDSVTQYTPPLVVSSCLTTASGMKHRGRKSKLLSSGKEASPKTVPTQGSLLSDIVSDLRRFRKAAYPYWKWPLLAYSVWMLSTLAVRTVYTTIVDEVQPICSTPWLGKRLPWCYIASSTKALDVAKLPASQLKLEGVMSSSGQGLGLAMDILHKEYTLRDLNIRVKHSKLEHKNDVGKELDTLVCLTGKTFRGLSRFTSRIASVAEMVIAFDNYSVRKLRAIIDHQKTRPLLLQRLVSALSPLAAFESRYETEEAIKRVFLLSADQMTSKLPALIDDASHLLHLLDLISDILGRIKGHTLADLKGTPEMTLLAKLWDKLASRDNYREYKSHRNLLNDVTMCYATASGVVRDTYHALLKVKDDLGGLRDLQEAPALLWRDIPLDVTIDQLSHAMKRLEFARSTIDGMDPVREALLDTQQ